VLISLATLSTALAKSARDTDIIKEETPEVEFSDDSPSEESSEEGSEGGSDSDES
jgi:hypothetical protein